MTYEFIFSSGTYHAAAIENCVDFNGHVVVDIGAGGSILSSFAAQVSTKIFMHEVFRSIPRMQDLINMFSLVDMYS